LAFVYAVLNEHKECLLRPLEGDEDEPAIIDVIEHECLRTMPLDDRHCPYVFWYKSFSPGFT